MRKWRVEKREWRKGWLLLVVVGIVLSVWLLARGAATGAGGAAGVAGENAGTGPGGGAGVAVTFVPVDMYVDAGSRRLGAYQVKVVAKDATIVGLEGGESKAFAAAPYYDPAALRGNKIVVASFSTDENLPTGLTRVARLHLMVEGQLKSGTLPEMTDKLVVATDGQGKTLDATLTLRPTPEQGAMR